MTEDVYPIELKTVIFTKASVVSIAGHKPTEGSEKTPMLLNNNVNLEVVNSEKHEYAFIMTSQFNLEKNPSEPYMVDMACMAIFKVLNLELPEEELHKALTITGHSIAYGAIRESVLWLSSRSIYGPFTLGISVLKNLTENKSDNQDM